MTTRFSQVFTTLGKLPTQNSATGVRFPMINSVTENARSFIFEVNQRRKKKALMNWYKTIPELTAFVNKVAKDVTTRYKFTSLDGKPARNKILKANNFAVNVKLRKVMKAQIIDALVTGEGYGWMGMPSMAQVKEHIKHKISERKGIETKEKNDIVNKLMLEIKQEEEDTMLKFKDEDILRPRVYEQIASSTMENIHDQFEIHGYKQVVGGKWKEFNLKEVIRYTLLEVDGKPTGYTSVEATIVQLELLRFMWQNMLAYEKNGGSPDYLINLKSQNPQSPQFKQIEEAWQKYKKVENKHGGMLMTGDVNVSMLEQLDKMQFKDMGLYITGLIAMQWGIPKDSIPYIIGGTNTKSDLGGGSSRAYWDVIRDMQRIFMEDMNTQLWIPKFGVRLVFENPNIQFDVQMETAKNMKLNNMKVISELAAENDKQLTFDSKLRMFGLEPNDFEKRPEEEMMMIENGGMNNQSPRNPKSEEQTTLNTSKRNEQLALQSSQGKPTGVGKEIKEWDRDTELEYKQIQGNDPMQVDIDTFITLYNEDKAYHPGQAPRLFERRNDMFTTYIFKSTDFVYKTVISNDIIEDNRIRIMNLDGKVYRL